MHQVIVFTHAEEQFQLGCLRLDQLPYNVYDRVAVMFVDILPFDDKAPFLSFALLFIRSPHLKTRPQSYLAKVHARYQQCLLITGEGVLSNPNVSAIDQVHGATQLEG